jgi:hypothetical protein
MLVVLADAEFSSAAAHKVDLAQCVREYYKHALPLLNTRTAEAQPSFLLIPASDPGKAFGEKAKQAVPELDLVLVSGQSDLMFCREQGYLAFEELRPAFHHCRQAYDDLSPVPNSSPHARFDITDWMPLDPG